MFEKKESAVFTVEGMKCEHCKKRVEDAARKVAGVKRVDINLSEKTVTVAYIPAKTSADTIMEAIKNAGDEVLA